MKVSLPRPRQRLALADLIGFDTSGWRQAPSKADSNGRAASTVSAKVGTKIGQKTAPIQKR